MPIESGHYIITNSKQRNVAFLPDSNDGTPLVGRDEQHAPGELWDVKARRNGHHSIENLEHKRHAVTKPRATVGETVEGRDNDQQWLIRETEFKGQYMIATIDNGRVWGLTDNWPDTPIALFDPRNDPRLRWIFNKIGSDNDPDPLTEARNLAKQEMAKRKEAEAGLEATRGEARDLRRQVTEEQTARKDAQWASKRDADEVARMATEARDLRQQMTEEQTAKKDAVRARQRAEDEATRMTNEVRKLRRQVEDEKAAKEDAIWASKRDTDEAARMATEVRDLRRQVTEEQTAKKEAVRANTEAADEAARMTTQIQMLGHQVADEQAARKEAERARTEATDEVNKLKTEIQRLRHQVEEERTAKEAAVRRAKETLGMDQQPEQKSVRMTCQKESRIPI